jgi:hypothetical protein
MEDMMTTLNKQQLIEQQSLLMADKMKLDKFFSMYLDKVGSKMDPDVPNTPVWKLYKEKLNEYESVTRRIRVLDFYIKGNAHV